MNIFWNWIKDEGGGRVLRFEGPIDNENWWGDEITPQMFREELEADEGDVTVWISMHESTTTNRKRYGFM